jgi:hypothetical protein
VAVESIVSRCACVGLLLLSSCYCPQARKEAIVDYPRGRKQRLAVVAGCASAGIHMRDGVHVWPAMLPGGIWHADGCWVKVSTAWPITTWSQEADNPTNAARITKALCSATPWILIGVGAFAPNQIESGVLGSQAGRFRVPDLHGAMFKIYRRETAAPELDLLPPTPPVPSNRSELDAEGLSMH